MTFELFKLLGFNLLAHTHFITVTENLFSLFLTYLRTPSITPFFCQLFFQLWWYTAQSHPLTLLQSHSQDTLILFQSHSEWTPYHANCESRGWRLCVELASFPGLYRPGNEASVEWVTSGGEVLLFCHFQNCEWLLAGACHIVSPWTATLATLRMFSKLWAAHSRGWERIASSFSLLVGLGRLID